MIPPPRPDSINSPSLEKKLTSLNPAESSAMLPELDNGLDCPPLPREPSFGAKNYT